MWIEVFKTGVHTDSSGNTREWTEQDLDKIVETYNNQPSEEKHEAPVVIGHPVTDSPAYGWVEKLERRGNVLLAKLKDLSKEFVDWVKKGLYKKRSIALYENLLLKHIGFLGAVPPAVKGLEDPVFAEGPSIEIEFPNLEFNQGTENTQTSPEKIHQEKRKEKYGIQIKDGLRFTKPDVYKELQDDDFGDPVHYRFPLTKPYILASLATWSRPSVQKHYSESEAQIIVARLLKAAKNYGINLTPFKWAYSQYVDVPIESLTKQQLLDLLQRQNQPQTYQETIMDENTFNQFVTDLLGWLSETFGEEVSAQTSAYIDENKSKYLQSQSSSAGTTPPPNNQANNTQANNTQSQNSQMSENPEIIKLQNRIAQLEMENRLKDFKSYTEKLIQMGKLLPAQEDAVISLLEMAHKHGAIKFAEKNKITDIQGVELVKRLLESYPEFGLFKEQAKATGNEYKSNEFADLPVDEKMLELHLKVKSYQEEMRKNGKEIPYKEALSIVTKGGQ